MKIYKLQFTQMGDDTDQAAVVVADDIGDASYVLSELVGAFTLCCIDKIGDGFPPARVVLDGVENVSG